jgi:hypothetical protein
MKLNKLITAAALLMAAAPALAANWVYVTTNDVGSDYYYDSDTIQRSGNQVTFWQKTDHSRDKTVKERESIDRYRFDCAMRTRTLLQVTNYYPDGNNESYTFSTYEQKENAVIPDTAGESMLEAVCR